MSILATKYDHEVVELQQIRWNEDLTGAQRAAISGELEKQRCIPEYAWVDPRELYVDEAYQRPISFDRVWEIATAFSWMLLDPLWVGRRRKESGRLYVVDGRHRLASCLILGHERIDKVPAQIRDTSGVEEEARIFVELTEKRRKINSAQRFAAKLVFKDPIAIDLQKILAHHNFKVPSDGFIGSINRMGESHHNEITCVGTLEAIYKTGGRKRVNGVLEIIRTAWDGRPPTTSAFVIRAVNRMIEHAPDKAPSTLAARLKERDPYRLLERGQRFANSNGIPISEAIADVFVTVVNE
jgi:hypothetical protein